MKLDFGDKSFGLSGKKLANFFKFPIHLRDSHEPHFKFLLY